MSDLPAPRQPYRAAVVFHAILAGVILLVAAISGGDLVRRWRCVRLLGRRDRLELVPIPAAGDTGRRSALERWRRGREAVSALVEDLVGDLRG